VQFAQVALGRRDQFEDRADLRPLRLRVDQSPGGSGMAEVVGDLANQAVQVVPGGV